MTPNEFEAHVNVTNVLHCHWAQHANHYEILVCLQKFNDFTKSVSKEGPGQYDIADGYLQLLHFPKCLYL